MDFTGVEIQMNIVKRMYARKALVDPVHFQ